MQMPREIHADSLFTRTVTARERMTSTRSPAALTLVLHRVDPERQTARFHSLTIERAQKRGRPDRSGCRGSCRWP